MWALIAAYRQGRATGRRSTAAQYTACRARWMKRHAADPVLSGRVGDWEDGFKDGLYFP